MASLSLCRYPSQLIKRTSRLEITKSLSYTNNNYNPIGAPNVYKNHAGLQRSFSSSGSSGTTDNSKVTDGTDLYQFYKDQLQELENERIELFGKNESIPNQSLSSSNDDEPPFMEMNMTVEEMNTNREAIYAFTKEEKAAWGSSITDNPLSSEYLDAINKAREAKAMYEASMQKDLEEKVVAMAREEVGRQDSSIDSGSSSYEESENDSLDFDPNDVMYDKPNNNHSYFTHLNPKGDEATMVDVGAKEITRRIAVARTTVVFPPEVMEAFDVPLVDSTSPASGKHEMIGTKGPIFATAKLAGIMGAKRTSDLIPLCHPLPLEEVRVDIRLEGNKALIECECCVTHKTGVEMEAMAGASIAALTIYDMVKAVSHKVQIERTELVTKMGGKRIVQDGTETKM
jgi:molybdenum cofactor biosynthesis protein MoaC